MLWPLGIVWFRWASPSIVILVCLASTCQAANGEKKSLTATPMDGVVNDLEDSGIKLIVTLLSSSTTKPPRLFSAFDDDKPVFFSLSLSSFYFFYFFLYYCLSTFHHQSIQFYPFGSGFSGLFSLFSFFHLYLILIFLLFWRTQFKISPFLWK